MTNLDHALVALDKLVELQMYVASAQKSALVIFERAKNEKRDLDPRELAVIDKMAQTASTELLNNLQLKVGTDGEISDGSQKGSLIVGSEPVQQEKVV